MVTQDYKYVRYFDGENREQLYDMKADPGEMRNAFHDKDKQYIVEKIRPVIK